jgi:hypothetical protein
VTPARAGLGPRSTRRGFLRLTGATLALAGLANLRVLPAAGALPAVAGRRFFSPADAERLTAIVERMVASDDPTAPAVRETRAVETIDSLCRVLDPGATRLLPVLLRLVDWGPLLFELRPSRFSALTDAEKDAHLAGWMRSRLRWRRLAFLALRNLSFLGYYSQAETWPAIGYAGPLLRRPEGAA